MKSKTQKHGISISVLGFIANLLIPGIGTIMLGQYELGIIQLTLLISAALVMFSNFPPAVYLLMIASVAAIWIWALATGIKFLKKAGK